MTERPHLAAIVADAYLWRDEETGELEIREHVLDVGANITYEISDGRRERRGKLCIALSTGKGAIRRADGTIDEVGGVDVETVESTVVDAARPHPRIAEALADDLGLAEITEGALEALPVRVVLDEELLAEIAARAQAG